MPINTDAILQTTLEKSKELAETLFKKFTDQAVSDNDNFLQRSKAGIARATALFASEQIDKDDFEDLIPGNQNLAEKPALTHPGLPSATIDPIVNGVLPILI